VAPGCRAWEAAAAALPQPWPQQELALLEAGAAANADAADALLGLFLGDEEESGDEERADLAASLEPPHVASVHIGLAVLRGATSPGAAFLAADVRLWVYGPDRLALCGVGGADLGLGPYGLLHMRRVDVAAAAPACWRTGTD
jgi:hypothetical protein